MLEAQPASGGARPAYDVNFCVSEELGDGEDGGEDGGEAELLDDGRG